MRLITTRSSLEYIIKQESHAKLVRCAELSFVGALGDYNPGPANYIYLAIPLKSCILQQNGVILFSGVRRHSSNHACVVT